MDIKLTLASALSITPAQVEAVLGLLDEGDTIPFIARYRKEKTGSMDDVTLRQFDELLASLQNLEKRREAILSSVEEQGKLTPELREAILSATKLNDLENLYRPYKKKRATRGSVALERGLGPLADYLSAQRGSEESLAGEARRYLNPEKNVSTVEEALQGAMDILSERAADEASFYDFAKAYIYKTGRLISKETKEDIEKTYLTYASFSCPVKALKNYQFLALSRGEKEKKLSVSYEYDRFTIINEMCRRLVLPHSPFETRLRETYADSYKRLIGPSVENEIDGELFTKAEDASIVLFQDNLRQLLLVPPLKGKRILGFDPAFVNGCKLAAVDERGKLLEVGVVYPTIGGALRLEESKRTILSFIAKYKIEIIALGNGTASRESEAFLSSLIQENHLSVGLVIVNEAGASVYSASPLGTEEFPSLPVEKRSAISLARRLQDPLAELVKIDPMSIGVGQYQHDMDEKKLSKALSGVVENVVNEVGVYINNASPSLLSYVSGIGPTLAQSIFLYREANGPFKSRKELLKVPKLGKKAFEQSAGFLRIPDGDPLDNTGVHPESYPAALSLLRELGLTPVDLGTPKAVSALSSLSDLPGLSKRLGLGLETLTDIVEELKKPGRDPREKVEQAVLADGVRDIKDLKVGMMLSGTVRNVMDFGLFVDIGVHQDGLVHVSELADHFVSNPLEVARINDIVKVKVLSVDVARKRIGLSMKAVKE